MKKLLALLLLTMLPFSIASAEGPRDQKKAPEKEGYVYQSKWLFLEDELLLVPGYASTFLFPVKVAASLTTLGLLFGFDKRKAVFRIPLGARVAVFKKKTKKRFYGPRSAVKSLLKEGFGETGAHPIFVYALMAAGAYAGYKIADWTIDTLLYAHRLRYFLRHWHDRSKKYTPKVFHDFFDYEHEKFKNSELLYCMRRTKKGCCSC